jgi:hypothetical protein
MTTPLTEAFLQSLQQRVKYSEGQLLRASDFTDEQAYILHRDDRHNLTLHGYGTVYGLDISIGELKGQREAALREEADAEREAVMTHVREAVAEENERESANNDGAPIRQINVSPGMGVDREGRVFVIRQMQCATNVDDWWLSVGSDDNNQRPSVIYVVAKYNSFHTAETSRVLHPVENGEKNNIFSRIEDSVTLELWNHRPQMPLYDAYQCLQELLQRVRLQASTAQGDYTAFNSALNTVRKCNDANWQAAYRLSKDALNRALARWTTRILPRIIEEDADESADAPWILLGEIPVDPASSNVPRLANGRNQPGIVPRPLLLPTQLLQPLMQLPGSSAGTGREVVAPRAQTLPLVTITPQLDEQNQEFALELWFHLDRETDRQDVRFAEAPQITVYQEVSDARRRTTDVLQFDQPQRSTFGNNVYEYTLATDEDEEFNSTGWAFLRVVIPASTVVQVRTTGNEREEMTLQEYMAVSGILFEGYQELAAGAAAFITYIRAQIPIQRVE